MYMTQLILALRGGYYCSYNMIWKMAIFHCIFLKKNVLCGREKIITSSLRGKEAVSWINSYGSSTTHRYYYSGDDSNNYTTVIAINNIC